MTDLTMFDSADDSQFPRGAQAYAGYVDGQVDSQPNYSWIVAEFPNAHHLSITLTAAEDADMIDVENGAAGVKDVPGWYDRQRARGAPRPGVYASASLMQSGIVPLVKSGRIPRASVRLWSAHYAGQHICGPASCGAVSIDMDGTQWTDSAYSRDLDESLLAASFFAVPASPVTKPAPKPAAAKERDMIIITTTAPAGHSWAGTRSFLYQPGEAPVHIEDEADRTALAAAIGISPAAGAVISWQQYAGFGGT